MQTYGIWPLPQNFRVYAEFGEISRKHGNSVATAKFRGSAQNSVARGKLWALLPIFISIPITCCCLFNMTMASCADVGARQAAMLL